MTTGALIVARLGSSRLKAKNLMPILGTPMIQHLAERLKRSTRLDTIAVATSTDHSDDALEDFAKTIGVACYRGVLDNVMERIAMGAESLGWDNVVEILGDNPLVHSELIDDVIDLFQREKLDYAANITNEYGNAPAHLKRFPIGVRVQIYKSSLAKQWREYPEFLTKDLGTSAYIFHNTDRYRCGYLEAKGKWEKLHQPEYHFAVNYQKNFDLIEKIFKGLYPEDKNFSLPQVVDFMQANPSLASLMGA